VTAAPEVAIEHAELVVFDLETTGLSARATASARSVRLAFARSRLTTLSRRSSIRASSFPRTSRR
jgi:hypothetical protein